MFCNMQGFFIKKNEKLNASISKNIKLTHLFRNFLSYKKKMDKL